MKQLLIEHKSRLYLLYQRILFSTLIMLGPGERNKWLNDNSFLMSMYIESI